MRAWAATIGAFGVLVATSAWAADAPPPANPPPPSPPAAAAAPTDAKAPTLDYRPFRFTHVLFKLPVGRNFANPHVGVFCLPSVGRSWTADSQTEVKPTIYADALRAEVATAGFKVDGPSDNIFEQTASTSDIQLAAIVTDLNLDYCQPMIGFGDVSTKGTGTMSIEWQVYSTLRKQMLAKITTTGSITIKNTQPGGLDALLKGAFKDNVHALIANADFLKAMAAPATDAMDHATAQAQSEIPLPGALAAKGRAVSDAVASVVMITAGEAQGSAFLISSDGLLATARHVVGDAKYVKVRWADGIESLGEVLRSDKVRDVALVKTDPRGRLPLRLRRDPLEPGDTVFAIGAPLDVKFQSTVTRGVVSAYRTFEGLNFIQSDVSVNPGSSGGPLLDDKGQVVEITEGGYVVAGSAANLNLFIPASDALEFLNAVPK